MLDASFMKDSIEKNSIVVIGEAEEEEKGQGEREPGRKIER